jgi:hypothetical protein
MTSVPENKLKREKNFLGAENPSFGNGGAAADDDVEMESVTPSDDRFVRYSHASLPKEKSRISETGFFGEKTTHMFESFLKNCKDLKKYGKIFKI